MRHVYKILLLALVALGGLPAHADQYLKQSTASQEVYFGPFVSDTDFKTAQTALSIANTDIKCLKAGGTTETNKNSGGATHIASGRYYAVMDATDTNTLGTMRCSIKMSGALEVWEDFQVTSANYFDNTYGSTIPAVNATQLSGDSTAADNIETAYDDTCGAVPWAGIARQCTAQSVTNTTLVMDSAAAIADNTANGQTVCAFGSTQGYWQCRTVAGNTLSTDTLTLSAANAWTVNPSGTITFKLFFSPPNNLDALAATGVKLDGMITGTPGVWTTASLVNAPAAQTREKTGSATATGTINTWVDSSRTETTNDAFHGWYVYWNSAGSNSVMTQRIVSYNGTSKTFTAKPDLPNVVGSGNTYVLVPDADALLAATTHTGVTIPTVGAVSNISAQTGDAYARLGAPAGASHAADVAAVKVDSAAVKAKTDFLPSATAGAAGGVFIAGTNAATTITTGLTTTFTGNLTGSVASVTGNVGGNVTGSVASVTGNVGGNVVGSVASVTGNVGGNVTGSVGSIATNGLTANSVATDAVTEIQSGLSTLTAASVRTALGLTSANLDTQLLAITGYVDDIGIAGAGLTAADDAIMTRLGAPVGASISADIAAVSSLNAAGVRAAIGLSSANLDAQLAAIPADVWAVTLPEPSGPPAWNASIKSWIAYIGAWDKNEIRQTSTTKTLRNDANNAAIATCPVGDSAGTFTSGKCVP